MFYWPSLWLGRKESVKGRHFIRLSPLEGNPRETPKRALWPLIPVGGTGGVVALAKYHKSTSAVESWQCDHFISLQENVPPPKNWLDFSFWMCHGTIYLLKLCITFQLDHCTYVELHDIIRISGSQISNANSSGKKRHFCQEPIQKEQERSLKKKGNGAKIPKRWGSMTYRVWEGMNKHESYWARRKNKGEEWHP